MGDIRSIWLQYNREVEISSDHFPGSGPFYGIIDGNVLRFTVTTETSDASKDLNFSGILNGNLIKGQYSIPHRGFVGEWQLSVEGSGPLARLTDFRDSTLDSPLISDIREIEAELADLRPVGPNLLRSSTINLTSSPRR